MKRKIPRNPKPIDRDAKLTIEPPGDMRIEAAGEMRFPGSAARLHYPRDSKPHSR